MSNLNFCSRFSRNKSAKKISTLYNLINNLNLQAIITDQLIERVSNLRIEHQQARIRSRNLSKTKSSKYSEKQKDANQPSHQSKLPDIDVGSVGNQEGKRRVHSCDKGDEKAVMTQRKFLDQVSRRSKISTDRSKGTNRKASINLPQQKKSKENSQKNSNKSISFDKILKEQPQQQLQLELEVQPQPQIVKKLSQPSSEKQSTKQFDSILPPPLQVVRTGSASVSIDQVLSYSPQSQQLMQINTNQRDAEKQDPFKNSNFDAVSQDLAELEKIDLRNSSYINHIDRIGVPNQMSFDCRSEKIQRLRGSDFQMGTDEEQDQYQDKKRFQYPPAEALPADYYQPQLQEEVEEENYVENEVEEEKLPQRHFADSPQQNYEQYHEQDLSIYQIQLHQPQNTNSSHQYIQPTNLHNSHQHSQYPSQIETPTCSILQHQSPGYPTNSPYSTVSPQAKKLIPFKKVITGRWAVSGTDISVVSRGPQSSVSSINDLHSHEHKERKPFKKMVMQKKFNPRMVTSTIVSESGVSIKKVNFKKIIKKDSENKKSGFHVTPEKKQVIAKPVQEKKKLLKAFFDLN